MSRSQARFRNRVELRLADERLRVVNDDKTLGRPQNAREAARPDNQTFRTNERIGIVRQDADHAIDPQRDRTVVRVHDDKAMFGRKRLCAEPEARAHVHQRNDCSAQIDHTRNERRLSCDRTVRYGTQNLNYRLCRDGTPKIVQLERNGINLSSESFRLDDCQGCDPLSLTNPSLACDQDLLTPCHGRVDYKVANADTRLRVHTLTSLVHHYITF